MKYLKENKRYTTIKRVILTHDLFCQNEWELEYADIDIYKTRTKGHKQQKQMKEHSVCPHCHCFVPLSGHCDCQC